MAKKNTPISTQEKVKCKDCKHSMRYREKAWNGEMICCKCQFYDISLMLDTPRTCLKFEQAPQQHYKYEIEKAYRLRTYNEKTGLYEYV